MKITLTLGLILFIGLCLRLVNFDGPMADLHSWRQSDTAAVARNLITDHFDVLHPRILNASSIDGIGRDNTKRYHFAEFPLYQLITAGVSVLYTDAPSLRDGVVAFARIVDRVVVRVSGEFLRDVRSFERKGIPLALDTTVLAGRTISIISSLFSIYVLYLLVALYFRKRVALLAAFLLAVLPYSVFWSRTILPDSMMILFSLLTLYLFSLWIKNSTKNSYITLSAITFGLALLLKAFIPFLLLPIGYLVYRKFEFNFWRQRMFWIYVFIAVFPFMVWRLWMREWPMSIPASGWLFDGSKLRLKPAWWHWLWQERIDAYMFNFPGLFFIGIALTFWKDVYRKLSCLGEEVAPLRSNGKQSKQSLTHYVNAALQTVNFYLSNTGLLRTNWFFPLCVVSCLLYIVVFATGNVQHEYYQLPLVPFGAVMFSAGFWYLWDGRKDISKYDIPVMYMRRAVLSLLVVVSVMLSWYKVRDWYSVGNPLLVYVGQRADSLLPKDAVVITDSGGDTTLLYYVNRSGWSVRDKQLDEMIDRGATVWLSMVRNEYSNKLEQLYEPIDETSEYVILDLTKKRDNPEWETIPRYAL